MGIANCNHCIRDIIQALADRIFFFWDHNGNKCLHFLVSSFYLMYFVFISDVYLYNVLHSILNKSIHPLASWKTTSSQIWCMGLGLWTVSTMWPWPWPTCSGWSDVTAPIVGQPYQHSKEVPMSGEPVAVGYRLEGRRGGKSLIVQGQGHELFIQNFLNIKSYSPGQPGYVVADPVRTRSVYWGRFTVTNGNMLPQQGCIWVFMLATTRDESSDERWPK